LLAIVMTDERRILLNTTVLGAAEGLGQFANLILVVSFARVFGASVMGYYSVAMSVGAVAAVFVGLGIQGLLIREFSRDPGCVPERLGVLFPVQLLLAPLAWAIACAISVALIGDTAASYVVMAACGYQVLMPLAWLLLTPLQARELMLVAASCGLSHRVLILVVGATAIWLGAGAGTVAAAFTLGALGLIALAWTQSSRRFGRPQMRLAPMEALRLYRLAAPFFGLTALAVFYARGAAITLSALTTSEAVGLYAAADRLMVAFGLGPLMFNTAAYPALARVAHASAREAQALSARCLRLLLIVAIPVAAVAAAFAPEIVRFCFGPEYLDAARALQVLAWTLPVSGARSLLGSQLAAMNQQGELARARFAGLAVFVVLAPLLIVSLGFVGAAWSVLICDALQLMLCWWLLKKVQVAPALAGAVWAPSAAAAMSLVGNYLLSDLGLIPRLAAVLLVMTTGMWLFGAVRWHDLRFLRALIAGK
jgi:O-antigen/teichoic acid export membrane protein